MSHSFQGVFGFSLAVMLTSGVLANAAGPSPAANQQPAQTVALFEAQQAGHVEVKLIPKDAAEGTVILTNKTPQPLTIKLPEGFAAVPVLAQRRGGGAAGAVGGGNANGGAGGGNQSLGGGFGGGQGGGLNGGGGIGGGGGFFNVPAERSMKLKVVTVCLEHGKKDPSPQVAYDIVSIDSYTSDARLHDLVKRLGRGEVDQRAAQAAAWHLANGLTWQQLAEKIGVKHLNGTTELYFSPAVLDRARQITDEACRQAQRSVPKL